MISRRIKLLGLVSVGIVGVGGAYLGLMFTSISSSRSAVLAIYRSELDPKIPQPALGATLRRQFADARQKLGPISVFRLGNSGIDEGLFVSHTEVTVERRGNLYRETILGYPKPSRLSIQAIDSQADRALGPLRL